MLSVEFVLYGMLPDGRGISHHMDFSSLKRRTCTGFETPDTSSSDYETWSPSDQMQKDCLLGQKYTYTRRKQDSKCFTQGLELVQVRYQTTQHNLNKFQFQNQTKF